MKSFSESFDHLHCMDCNYSVIDLGHETRVEVASGLALDSHHPAYVTFGANCPAATFIFRNVSKVDSILYPYKGAPTEGQFEDEITETKHWPVEDAARQKRYSIEGLLENGRSYWVELDITAESFELQVK